MSTGESTKSSAAVVRKQSDMELLHLAATATKRKIGRVDGRVAHLETGEQWRPLDDDAEAFRLLVEFAMRVDVDTSAGIVRAGPSSAQSSAWWVEEPIQGGSRYTGEAKTRIATATRRAIVRAAGLEAPPVSDAIRAAMGWK